MTTHPNARLLASSYQAVEQGDLQPILAMMHENITWTDSTLGPLSGTYRKDEVSQFFGKMMDAYAGTLRVEIADLMADENHGIVLTRESGTVDGETVAWTGVHIWSFDKGRATGFVSYGSAEYQRFWADRHGTSR